MRCLTRASSMAGAGQSSREMASSELEGFNGGRQAAQSIELDVESREASWVLEGTVRVRGGESFASRMGCLRVLPNSLLRVHLHPVGVLSYPVPSLASRKLQQVPRCIQSRPSRDAG